MIQVSISAAQGGPPATHTRQPLFTAKDPLSPPEMPESAQQPLRQHQPGLGQQIDQSAGPIEALKHSNQYDTNGIAAQWQQPREYLA